MIVNETVACNLLLQTSALIFHVFADSSLLKSIEGAHLDCVIKNHPAMKSMVHLLPENVLVSGDENIPGLVASPTGKPHATFSNALPYKTYAHLGCLMTFALCCVYS